MPIVKRLWFVVSAVWFALMASHSLETADDWTIATIPLWLGAMLYFACRYVLFGRF